MKQCSKFYQNGTEYLKNCVLLNALILKGDFIIHMDKTYDIGIYHVTTLSYTNVKLINRETKKNPLFLGPMYIHKKSKN